MLVLLIALCAAEIDLPFDDGQSQPVVEEKPAEPTHTIIPLNQMIGPIEYGALAVAIVYIVFFIVGGRTMARELKRAEKGVEKLRKYFYVVPSRFLGVTRHDYHAYVTGRRGYLGGFVTIHFTKRSDVLGFIYDTILGRRTRVVFEFVCEPERQLPAIFSLRKRILYGHTSYNLKERKIDELGLTLWTDFGAARTPFVEAACEYAKKRPGRLVSIDLNDCNRFETCVAGRFVARVELNVDCSFETFFDDETVEFVMDVADRFNKLELSDKRYDKNVRERTCMNTPKEKK